MKELKEHGGGELVLKGIGWFFVGGVIGVVVPRIIGFLCIKVFCWQQGAMHVMLGNLLQLLIVVISILTCVLFKRRKALFLGTLIFIIPSTVMATFGWDRMECSSRIHDEVTIVDPAPYNPPRQSPSVPPETP